MSDTALAPAIKGWLAGCLTASTVFFIFGLQKQIAAPDGLTPGLLVFGIFWSLVHFIFIAIFTAAPAALFIWSVNKLRAQYLALFIPFGALLGLLAQLVFNPLNDPTILLVFVLAGSAAGMACWFVTQRRNPATGTN